MEISLSRSSSVSVFLCPFMLSPRQFVSFLYLSSFLFSHSSARSHYSKCLACFVPITISLSCSPLFHPYSLATSAHLPPPLFQLSARKQLEERGNKRKRQSRRGQGEGEEKGSLCSNRIRSRMGGRRLNVICFILLCHMFVVEEVHTIDLIQSLDMSDHLHCISLRINPISGSSVFLHCEIDRNMDS